MGELHKKGERKRGKQFPFAPPLHLMDSFQSTTRTWWEAECSTISITLLLFVPLCRYIYINSFFSYIVHSLKVKVRPLSWFFRPIFRVSFLSTHIKWERYIDLDEWKQAEKSIVQKKGCLLRKRIWIIYSGTLKNGAEQESRRRNQENTRGLSCSADFSVRAYAKSKVFLFFFSHGHTPKQIYICV